MSKNDNSAHPVVCTSFRVSPALYGELVCESLATDRSLSRVVKARLEAGRAERASIVTQDIRHAGPRLVNATDGASSWAVPWDQELDLLGNHTAAAEQLTGTEVVCLGPTPTGFKFAAVKAGS